MSQSSLSDSSENVSLSGMATEEVAGIVGEAAASNDFLCVLQIYRAFGHLLIWQVLEHSQEAKLSSNL